MSSELQILKLVGSTEEQDTNTLEAGEAFVIDGLELRTGRGIGGLSCSSFALSTAFAHLQSTLILSGLTIWTAWCHPSHFPYNHQRSPANHPLLKTVGGSNCPPNTQPS